MNALRSIPVRNLFAIAIGLKIVLSLLGWYYEQPWYLGFYPPLIVMFLYVVLGWKRGPNDVSDEKFADSCYYMGFIFTVASISIALLDIPQIGTRIQDIAVRFGAAMLSTVFGLIVRVYKVGFVEDADDAVASAEIGVIEAAHKLDEHLRVASDRLVAFSTKVDEEAAATVERVKLQVEHLTKNHAEKLEGFLQDLGETLAKPLDTLAQSANAISDGVHEAAGQVKEAGSALSAALKSIKARSAGTEAVLERVSALAAQQEASLKSSMEQISAVSTIAQTFAGFQQVLGGITDQLAVSSSAFRVVLERLENMVKSQGTSATALNETLQQMISLSKAANDAHAATLDRIATFFNPEAPHSQRLSIDLHAIRQIGIESLDRMLWLRDAVVQVGAATSPLPKSAEVDAAFRELTQRLESVGDKLVQAIARLDSVNGTVAQISTHGAEVRAVLHTIARSRAFASDGQDLGSTPGISASFSGHGPTQPAGSGGQ